MKTQNLLVCIAVSGMLCWSQALYGQIDLEKDAANVDNILIQANEILGVAVRKTWDLDWVTGIDSSGKPRSSHGVIQEVEIQGVKARIHYAEFSTDDAARGAVDFHINNMASIFRRGLWNGAKRVLIGDETWFDRDPRTLAVLIRSGSICVLICCRDGDIDAQARIAEKLAEHLAKKVKEGAYVPASGKFR